MPPATTAAAAQRGREVVEGLLASIEWAAYDRDQALVQSLMEQLAALGGALPRANTTVDRRVFLAGLDEIAAGGETPEDFKHLLDVLDTHHELFGALGREGERQLFETRVAAMRQAAAAALRQCFEPVDIADLGLDPGTVNVGGVDLRPYLQTIEKFFPKELHGTPGKALRSAAEAGAPGQGQGQGQDEGEAYCKELMRNSRRELISVTDGTVPSASKCRVILHMAEKPAFVAQVRAMTRRVEAALLGLPERPRQQLGTRPAAAEPHLGDGLRHWPEGRATEASAQDFHRQSRNHMRTLLAAAQAAAEEGDLEDEEEEEEEELERGRGARGGGGGGGAGARPRYNDLSRPGRAVSFEDSQYHGEDTDSEEEEEEDGGGRGGRRGKRYGAASAASGGGGGATAKRHRAAAREEVEEDSDVDSEEIQSVSSSGSDSSDEDGGQGGGAAGKGKGKGKVKGRKAYARHQVSDKTVIGVSRRVVPKRRRIQWRDEEVDALEEAVGKGFKGDWAGILKHKTFGPKFDASRTSVDLKDKWRNLEKAKLK